MIVTEFGVSWVKVRLNKQGAIRGARDVGIEIERRARTTRVTACSMAEVFVAAGSNVEPEKNLARALDELAAGVRPLRVSPAYRNQAVGFEGADFINLVVGFRTDETRSSRCEQTLEGIEALAAGRAMRRNGRRARWISTSCCSARW